MDDDILGEYREKIVCALAWLGAFLLLPFAINNLFQDRALLAVGTLAICFILTVDAIALRRKQALPIRLFWLFPPVVGSLAIGIARMGVPAVLWSYPAMILFYFIMNRIEATLMNLAVVVVAGGSAWYYLGQMLTLRIVATLLLTCLFCHIFLSIIVSLQRKLQLQTITDPLTGAYNRREMERGLVLAMDRSRRLRSPMSVLAIDVDHFKKINDQLGHSAGDCALKTVVELLRGRLRKLDQLYRSGGEEFVVLLSDCPCETACLVGEALRQRVAVHPILSERTVTISIGVAELQDGDTLSSWLHRGDLGLYEAKRSGRNRVRQAPA